MEQDDKEVLKSEQEVDRDDESNQEVDLGNENKKEDDEIQVPVILGEMKIEHIAEFPGTQDHLLDYNMVSKQE